MNNVVGAELVRLRREFHQCAETGWLEFETTVKIITYLKEMGLEVNYGKKLHGERLGLPSKEIMEVHRRSLQDLKVDFPIEEILEGYTGATALLDTGRAGPTVALRFDIDCNGVEEAKGNHRPFIENFASKNPGMTHACGHDGHIAMGLMVIKELLTCREQMKGKILFIFQPAEEGVRGARSMVEAGILKGVDFCLSGHIGFMGKKNQIICGVGGFYATNKLDVSFYGQPAHAGASPELGKNALLAGAICALNLHTLTQISGGASRINVGTFHAGTARNVVPAEARLEVETRGEIQEINDALMERVFEVIEGSAKMYDVRYETKLVGSAPAYHYKKNEFQSYILELLKELDLDLDEGADLGASEDVSYMLRAVEEAGGKALYFVFGAERTAPHHSSNFDFSEEALENGYRCYVKTVTDLLKIE